MTDQKNGKIQFLAWKVTKVLTPQTTNNPPINIFSSPENPYLSVVPEFVLISDTDSRFWLRVESVLTLDGLTVMRPAIRDHRIIITAENGTEREGNIMATRLGMSFL